VGNRQITHYERTPAFGAEAGCALRQDCYLTERPGGPIILRLHGIAAPLIVLPLTSRSCPDAIMEDCDTFLLCQRRITYDVLRLLEKAYHRDRKPKLHVYHGASCEIAHSAWEDLVLSEGDLFRQTPSAARVQAHEKRLQKSPVLVHIPEVPAAAQQQFLFHWTSRTWKSWE
jgi:hypothetical protein